MQHVPAGVFLPALASVSRFSDCCRWMIQTWSRESTDTPIVEPSTQWFGNGFGQNGSTSKRGATPGAPDSAAGAAAGAGVAAWRRRSVRAESRCCRRRALRRSQRQAEVRLDESWFPPGSSAAPLRAGLVLRSDNSGNWRLTESGAGRFRSAAFEVCCSRRLRPPRCSRARGRTRCRATSRSACSCGPTASA